MIGPAACGRCGQWVRWNGKMWRNWQHGRVRHVCAQDRPRCGVMMPNAGERCARRPGHKWDHRSEYALANARRRWAA